MGGHCQTMQCEMVDGWALAGHLGDGGCVGTGGPLGDGRWVDTGRPMGYGGWVGAGRPMGGRGLVGKPMGLMGGQANLQFTIFADSNFSFKYYVP